MLPEMQDWQFEREIDDLRTMTRPLAEHERLH